MADDRVVNAIVEVEVVKIVKEKIAEHLKEIMKILSNNNDSDENVIYNNMLLTLTLPLLLQTNMNIKINDENKKEIIDLIKDIELLNSKEDIVSYLSITVKLSNGGKLGIGLNDSNRITELNPDMPATRAGLRVDDRVLKVNDINLDGKLLKDVIKEGDNEFKFMIERPTEKQDKNMVKDKKMVRAAAATEAGGLAAARALATVRTRHQETN